MALAKVRALHPDFFSDEAVAEVSIPARLLFAGLWCFACDNGHLADKPKQIKRWIYATDDVNAAELLRELEAEDLIERDGQWISIPGLMKRQRIDYRYFKSCDREGCDKPSKPDSQPETPRGNAGATQSHAVTTRGPATDGDGDGDGDGDLEIAPAAKPAITRGSRLPSAWQPTEAHRSLAAERGVSLAEEVEKFRDWAASNGATKKDWDATFRNWIRNAKANATPFARPAAPHIAHVSELATPPDGLSPDEYAEWEWQQRQKRAAR